jgi:hypothetical protein
VANHFTDHGGEECARARNEFFYNLNGSLHGFVGRTHVHPLPSLELFPYNATQCRFVKKPGRTCPSQRAIDERLIT